MKLFQAFLTESEQKIQLIDKTQGKKILVAYDEDRGHGKPKVETSYEIIAELDSWSEKYLQWLVNMYLAKQFSLEDKARLTRDIADFEKYKSRLQTKDINQIKRLDGLEAAIEQLVDDGVVSKRQEDKKLGSNFIKSGDAEIFYETKGLKIIIPNTMEAAQYFGRGTQWCTAATNVNRFAEYSKEGKLYIFISDMGKFQLWFNEKQEGPHSVQFMDEKDNPIPKYEIDKLVKEYPEILKLFKRNAELHNYVPLLGATTDEELYKILEDKFKTRNLFSTSIQYNAISQHRDYFISDSLFDYAISKENYKVIDGMLSMENYNERWFSKYHNLIYRNINSKTDINYLISFLYKPKIYHYGSQLNSRYIFDSFNITLPKIFDELLERLTKDPQIYIKYKPIFSVGIASIDYIFSGNKHYFSKNTIEKFDKLKEKIFNIDNKKEIDSTYNELAKGEK